MEAQVLLISKTAQIKINGDSTESKQIKRGNKKMKVKVGQLVGSSEPLGKLMTQPMPSATAFRCAKTLKAVQAELESYEEARKNLIEQHGKDGEIKPEDKGWKKFIAGMEELMETEVKVDAEKIKEENLSKVEIAPADILALDWIIEE